MNKIVKLPKYMPGQVIDLSYKHKGLPNRILIKTVFVREQDNEWMYDAYLENIGKSTTLDETFITENMTCKRSNVYKCAEVIRLYNNGWRYCGNYKKEDAHIIASKNATNRYIKDIILKPALNSGGYLQDGYYGMWIRYNNIINDDGIISKNESDNDIIVIK